MSLLILVFSLTRNKMRKLCFIITMKRVQLNRACGSEYLRSTKEHILYFKDSQWLSESLNFFLTFTCISPKNVAKLGWVYLNQKVEANSLLWLMVKPVKKFSTFCCFHNFPVVRYGGLVVLQTHTMYLLVEI